MLKRKKKREKLSIYFNFQASRDINKILSVSLVPKKILHALTETSMFYL